MKEKDLEKLVEKLSKESQVVSSNMYGSALKNERKRRKLTLEKITEGICSKSYVSKVENNQLTPDDELMKCLFERVHIDYNSLKNNNGRELLKKVIGLYINEDYNQIEEIFSSINLKVFISSYSLIGLFYYLYKNKFDAFTEEVKRIDLVKNSLVDYEIWVLFICCIEFYIKTNQFEKALSYIDLIKKYTSNDIFIRRIFNMQKMIVYYQLKMDNLFNKLFYKEKNDLFMSLPFNKIDQIKLMKNVVEIDEDSFFPDNNYKDNNSTYLKVYSDIKNNHIIEGIDELIKYNSTDPQFIIFLAYLIKESREKNIDVKYSNVLEHYLCQMDNNSNDELFMAFIKVIKMEISKTEDIDIYNYYHNVVLDEMRSHQNRFCTKYLKEKYINILGSLSKYKEAYLFLK